jgi:hypothetical protein
MRFAQRLAAFVLALALGAAPARSSQNSLVTPTTGPHTMADFTGNYLNPALDSILSNYSGASAPGVGAGGVAKPYQFWFDTSTSPSTLKLFDGSSWVAVGALDTAGHTWRPYTLEVPNAQTASYTVTTADLGKLVSINNAGSTVAALPQATGSFGSGFWFDFCNRGAGTTSLTPTTSTINAQLTLANSTGFCVRVVSDGANWQLGSSAPNASPGSRVLLNTITASGASVVADTTSFTAGYSDYEVVIENLVPSTNAVSLSLQVYANGAFQTTNYYSAVGTALSTTGGGNYGSTTSVLLVGSPNISSTTALGGVSGTIRFHNVNQSNFAKHITSQTGAAYSTGANIASSGAGMWPTTGTPYVVSGFQILFSSGTATGVVKVYGSN